MRKREQLELDGQVLGLLELNEEWTKDENQRTEGFVTRNHSSKEVLIPEGLFFLFT